MSAARAVKRIDLSDAALGVLRESTVEGNLLRLPARQLDRGLYVEVDKGLRLLGGRWDRRARAHVFEGEVTDRLAEVVDLGRVVAEQFGHFPTPANLARLLTQDARLDASHTVLEPSAGTGALADAAAEVVPVSGLCLVEAQPSNCATLRDKGYAPIEGDFLALALPTFDRVIMNPPFERKQDMRHVTHAFALLNPGGRLAAIMSSGAMTGSTREHQAFQALVVSNNGTVTANPDDAFKESGTMVRTIRVTLDRPEGAAP